MRLETQHEVLPRKGHDYIKIQTPVFRTAFFTCFSQLLVLRYWFLSNTGPLLSSVNAIKFMIPFFNVISMTWDSTISVSWSELFIVRSIQCYQQGKTACGWRSGCCVSASLCPALKMAVWGCGRSRTCLYLLNQPRQVRHTHTVMWFQCWCDHTYFINSVQTCSHMKK